MNLPLDKNNMKVFDKENDRYIYSTDRLCHIVKKCLKAERRIKMRKIMKKKIKKHNPARYGEEYNPQHFSNQLEELERIKNWIVLSGGWAWHFMSPPHTEYKHLHDHRDIDIFVKPENFLTVQLTLEANDWYRMKTKYDNNNFIRYEKIKDERKMVIDMFKGEIPNIVANGWNVAEPNHLLSLYYTVHQSDQCIAVQKSRELIKKGISPIYNDELIKLPL